MKFDLKLNPSLIACRYQWNPSNLLQKNKEGVGLNYNGQRIRFLMFNITRLWLMCTDTDRGESRRFMCTEVDP